MAARRLEHPRPSSLPVLFLPSPALVLPALMITVSTTDDLVRPLVKLAQQSESPILGVFPFLGDDTPIHEWGCGKRHGISIIISPPLIFSCLKSRPSNPTFPSFRIAHQHKTFILLNPPRPYAHPSRTDFTSCG